MGVQKKNKAFAYRVHNNYLQCTSGSNNSALKEISVSTPFVHKMTKRVGERQQSYFSKIDLIM